MHNMIVVKIVGNNCAYDSVDDCDKYCGNDCGTDCGDDCDNCGNAAQGEACTFRSRPIIVKYQYQYQNFE